MSPSLEGQTSAGRGPRIEVDRKRCEGHGLCLGKAPELLHHDENGELVIDGDELGGEALEERVPPYGLAPLLLCGCLRHRPNKFAGVTPHRNSIHPTCNIVPTGSRTGVKVSAVSASCGRAMQRPNGERHLARSER